MSKKAAGVLGELPTCLAQPEVPYLRPPRSSDLPRTPLLGGVERGRARSPSRLAEQLTPLVPAVQGRPLFTERR